MCGVAGLDSNEISGREQRWEGVGVILRQAGGWLSRVKQKGTGGVWKGGCGLLSAKTPLVSSDRKSNPNQLKALETVLAHVIAKCLNRSASGAI